MKRFRIFPGPRVRADSPLGGPKPVQLTLSTPKVLEYKPVDKSPKYTAVSLARYQHTKGVIMRDQKGQSLLLGYCTETPREVLEAAFPKFHVTQYRGFDLFDSGDFNKTTPMSGLVIGGVNPVFGINGRLQDLLKLEQLAEATRTENISPDEINRILAYLNRKEIHAFPHPNDLQMEYIQTELCGALESFLKQ